MRIRAVLCAAMSAACVFSNVLAQEDDGSFGFAYGQYNDAIEAGDNAAAMTYAALAYERGEEAWGQGEEQLGDFALTLGNLYLAERRFQDAVNAYKNCTVILGNHMPGAAVNLATCWKSLAILQNLGGDADGSVASFRQAAAVAEQAPEDPAARAIAGDAWLALASLVLPMEAGYLRTTINDALFDLAAERAAKALPYITESAGEGSEKVARLHMILGHYALKDEPEKAAGHYGLAYEIYSRTDDIDEADRQRAYTMLRYALNPPDLMEVTEDGVAALCNWVQPDGAAAVACMLKRQVPRYPNRIGDIDGIGLAVIMFDVGEDGVPLNIRTVDSSHDGGFSETSEKAVKDWRFEPPIDEAGEPVVLRDMVVMFRFRLIR